MMNNFTVDTKGRGSSYHTAPDIWDAWCKDNGQREDQWEIADTHKRDTFSFSTKRRWNAFCNRLMMAGISFVAHDYDGKISRKFKYHHGHK